MKHEGWKVVGKYQRYMLSSRKAWIYTSLITLSVYVMVAGVRSESRYEQRGSCLADILRTTTASSLIRCSTLCNVLNDCVAYGYSPDTHTCRLSKKFSLGALSCASATPFVAGETVFIGEEKLIEYMYTMTEECRLPTDPLLVGVREDIVGCIKPVTENYWGEWGYLAMCTVGSYVSGFLLKIQSHQGSGDDTALNGIRLECSTSQAVPEFHNVTSYVGNYGAWTYMQECPDNQYLTGAQVKSESYQGFGDDKAVNDYNFECTSTSAESNQILHGGSSMTEGTWSDWVSCPTGTYICGLMTKMEWEDPYDSTSLNNAIFYCCEHIM